MKSYRQTRRRGAEARAQDYIRTFLARFFAVPVHQTTCYHIACDRQVVSSVWIYRVEGIVARGYSSLKLLLFTPNYQRTPAVSDIIKS